MKIWKKFELKSTTNWVEKLYKRLTWPSRKVKKFFLNRLCSNFKYVINGQKRSKFNPIIETPIEGKPDLKTNSTSKNTHFETAKVAIIMKRRKVWNTSPKVKKQWLEEKRLHSSATRDYRPDYVKKWIEHAHPRIIGRAG